MANISVAAEWQLLHNRYYRKPQIYTMQWRNMDISINKLACAPFGGPIAAIRDDSKLVQLLSEPSTPHLRIFSSSGLLLSTSPWIHHSSTISSMSWSEDQTLICLLHDSTLLLFDLHATLLHPPLSLPHSPTVSHSIFWARGLILLTNSNHLFSLSDLSNPTFTKLQSPQLSSPPFSLALIQPQHTMSGNPELLLSLPDHVLLLEEDGCCTQLGDGLGPLHRMVVSQNGKLLACFTHDSRLLVMNTDFSILVFEHRCDSYSSLPPSQIAWCGLDSVVLRWDDDDGGGFLVMVGPFGEPLIYNYDEPFILIPEADGVRVLSNNFMEFLHRVPDSTVSVFKIGSALPSALLYDAFDNFSRRSAKADENLRLIRSSLPEAVEECIEAAGHEFDVGRQRALLMAASYGQAFCNPVQRDGFQETCRSLRVLNAVRSREVGIPLTIQQYRMLTPFVMVSRLINSHHHLLALRVSEYLSLPKKEYVVQHWACCKISSSSSSSTSMPDGILLDLLLEKLKLCRGASYASVASHADGVGRRRLASMLAEHEPKPSKQVPLLLRIGEVERALSKAMESGDTDLVYLVLLHARSKLPTPEFFSMIGSTPGAADLFTAYAAGQQAEVAKEYYIWSGRVEEVAYMVWREWWARGGGDKEMEMVQRLMEERREKCWFEEKAAEEQRRLVKIQEEMERRTKREVYVGSSVSDTLRTCLVMGNEKGVARVKGEMKVNEKRWYWVKVMAMAGMKDWVGLERFVKEKRPPIGYRPLVEVCIEAGERAEAVKYIRKLGDARERAEFYAAAGFEKEAAEAAALAQDGDQLLARFRFPLSLSNSGGGGGGVGGGSSIFFTLKDVLSSLHTGS